MARPRKLPAGMWKRADTYYARFRSGGRLVRKRLSTDFDAACDILAELRARASRGEFNLIDNDYPWADLKAEFLRWARQAVRNPHEYERDLNRFESYCRVQSVKQVDQQYILGYREWRLAQPRGNVATDDPKTGRKADPAKLTLRVSPRTVNKEVATLRCMLNKAVAWERIASNPAGTIKPLKNGQPRKERRALSLEEVQAIFEHTPDYLQPIFRTFMTTGIRHDELVELRFSDIDFERKAIVIQAHQAKSGKAREIPLDDETGAMLAELRARAGERQAIEGRTPAGKLSREHVFVTRANTPLRNNLLQRFYAICKKAEIEGAHPGGSVDIHSLRVSFTTLALENGASPKAVQAILGHSTLALTMSVYAKATEKAKREAIAALPFATVTGPAHVVSVHGAHKVSTPEKTSTQNKKQKHVAS